MFSLQGFIQITALKDNAPEGAVSPVGELSDLSLTAAKNKQYFAKANGQVEFVAFTYERNGIKVKVPAHFTDHVLALSQWIYSQAVQGVLTNDELAFQRLFVGEHQQTTSAVQSGGMVQCNGNWFPRWVSWKFETQADKVDDPADLENRIIIWFADKDFDEGYQGYEIEVQMPIKPVDTFQSTKSVVAKAMESFNLPDHDDNVNKLAGLYPFTARKTHNFTWHDRENRDSTMMVPMTLIIYGRAGLNPSRQKQALREHILANSEHPVADWVKVFPEIFTSTMFTIVPCYKIRGVPNLEDQAALYLPMPSYDLIAKAVSKFGAWSQPAVGEKTNSVPVPTTDVCVLPTLFKSLTSTVIAGAENEEGKKTLQEIVPDYALIAEGPDFSRISAETAEWIRLLFQAMIAAEEYHDYNSSFDIAKHVDETNPELYYWVFEYKNVEFRVVARKAVW